MLTHADIYCVDKNAVEFRTSGACLQGRLIAQDPINESYERGPLEAVFWGDISTRSIYGCMVHQSRADVSIIAVRMINAGRTMRRSLLAGDIICGA